MIASKRPLWVALPALKIQHVVRVWMSWQGRSRAATKINMGGITGGQFFDMLDEQNVYYATVLAPLLMSGKDSDRVLFERLSGHEVEI